MVPTAIFELVRAPSVFGFFQRFSSKILRTKVQYESTRTFEGTLTSVRVCTTIGPTLQDIREAIRLPLNSFFSVRSGHHIFSVATLVSLPVGPAHSESS